MAMAPSGKPVEKKDPREVYVDVALNGDIRVLRNSLSRAELAQMLRKMVQDNRGLQIPVIIRGDERTRHEAIKKVMDACAYAGIWKIKFAALKERGS